MEFINLTPHALVVAGRTIEPSGQVARVSVEYVDAGRIGGIPVVIQQFGERASLTPRRG